LERGRFTAADADGIGGKKEEFGKDLAISQHQGLIDTTQDKDRETKWKRLLRENGGRKHVWPRQAKGGDGNGL